MTDADRTDKAEERENMYIMMFTLQSLQNYGLSVKSAPGEATLCQMRIPAIDSESAKHTEEKTNVSGTDRR